MDIFSNKHLKRALKTLAAVFPNKSKNESAIRAKDLADVKNGVFPEKVPHLDVHKDGFDRNKILCGVAVFYDSDSFTEKDMSLINDAGFDFVLSDAGEKTREIIIEKCEEYSIAYIGSDKTLPNRSTLPERLKNDEPIFANYDKNPVHVGDSVWDEPNTAEYELMELLRKRYNEELPSQFIFYNLFPKGASKKQLGADSYTDYINKYAKAVNTDYISLDIYPFYSFSAINKVAMQLCLDTYDTVGYACRRDGKDFWLYIQTQCNWFSCLYNFTTYEQILWQIFTSIAYGCKSIIHAAYCPVWGDEATAIVDRDGNLTEQYLYVRRANSYIQPVSRLIASYKNLGVFPVSGKNKNKMFSLAFSAQNKRNANTGFSGLPIIKEIEAESSLVVGCFKNNDGVAIMPVNCKDLFDATASQEVNVTLTQKSHIRVWHKGLLEKEYTDCASFSIKLDSCEGVFIEILN